MLNLDPVYYELMERDPKNWTLRKLQILHAAVVQFGEKGLTDTSYESLAKELGIGRSNIVYYFAEKDSLLLEVIRFVGATGAQITGEAVEAARARGDKDLVLAAVNGCFDWAERFPLHVRIMCLFYFFSATNKTYRKLHTELRGRGRQRLMAAVGGSRSRAEKTGRAIQALMTGYLIEFISMDDARDLAQMRAECLAAVKEVC